MSIPFGLCDGCVHQRRVGNTRGSTFSLCGLARTDDRFPKYPRMPVLRCEGFERRDDGRDAAAGSVPAGGRAATGPRAPRGPTAGSATGVPDGD